MPNGKKYILRIHNSVAAEKALAQKTQPVEPPSVQTEATELGPNQKLLRACYGYNLELIKEAIADGADVNYVGTLEGMESWGSFTPLRALLVPLNTELNEPSITYTKMQCLDFLLQHPDINLNTKFAARDYIEGDTIYMRQQHIMHQLIAQIVHVHPGMVDGQMEIFHRFAGDARVNHNTSVRYGKGELPTTLYLAVNMALNPLCSMPKEILSTLARNPHVDISAKGSNGRDVMSMLQQERNEALSGFNAAIPNSSKSIMYTDKGLHLQRLTKTLSNAFRQRKSVDGHEAQITAEKTSQKQDGLSIAG